MIECGKWFRAEGLTYRRAAGFFPIVTLTFVARLATGDGQEWPELISYAPWVREDAEEEE